MSDNGNGEAQDFQRRKDLWDRLQADPDGYEANRDFGLYCASRRNFFFLSEPYLLKALSFNRWEDDHARDLLRSLGEIYKTKGDYGRARQVLSLAHKGFPRDMNNLYALGDVEYHCGDLAEASRIYRTGMDIMALNARSVAEDRGSADRRILAPIGVTYRHLGEIAQKLDLFVKARALGLIKPFEALFLAPDDRVANRCFAGCWADHVTVVSDPDEVRACEAEYGGCQYYMDVLTTPDGLSVHRELGYGLVQRMWGEQDRPPPLALPENLIARGRERLEKAGLPKDAWFAALHVREPGFFDEDMPWNHNKYRNCNIMDYLPAIREIVARGGWVVRMGDPSMTPLAGIEGVIDYALGDFRSDWMDVFGLSQCRFFLGTPSGPMHVSLAFGVPVVGTNFFPVGPWPFSRNDIFIHKLHRAAGDGRWLPLAEVMKAPLFSAWNPQIYEAHGVGIVDDTAEDIREAVCEMLDRLDGTEVSDPEGERLREAYARGADPYGIGFALPVARSFLRRYPHLVDGA